MSGRIDPSDYLLGELDAGDRVEAERLLREDSEFRSQVERLRPVVSGLEEVPDEAWLGLEPPPERAAPSAREATGPSVPPKPRRRLVLRPALAFAACVALLAAGAGIGALLLDRGDQPVASAETIDLRPVSASAANAQGVARLDSDAGEAAVELSGIAPSRPSEYYELWLLSGPDQLVSLGSFRVPESGDAAIRVPMPVDPQLFRFLDVSVERVDEGPEHSGLSVLRART